MAGISLESGRYFGSEQRRLNLVKLLEVAANKDLHSSEPNAGWQGFIRVDGTVYRWMGAAPGASADVTQTEFTYTSSKSIFIMDVAGKVEMNITFLSPVTPTDLKRQSLAFSYLNVEVKSLDGVAHSVQLYSDVSAGEPSWPRHQMRPGELLTLNRACVR